MSQSVALPALPENPAPIIPPTLATTAPPALPAKDYAKLLRERTSEIAREVKRYARKNPGLVIQFEKKPYPCREIVQFCAACFGVTAMVTSTEEVISDGNQELGFVAVAHAIDATGRVVSGAEAACMYSESDWAGKPSYQLRSMAQTRACSKVLCNLFAYVLRMAGFCPTPAEEMGGSPNVKREREITTPCDECGNAVTAKRRLAMRKKHGRSLCLDCEKKHLDKQGEALTAPLNDAARVAEHVAQVKQRKANGKPQPIVDVLDSGEQEIA